MDNVLEIWNSAPNGVELQKALTDMKEQNKKAVPKSAIIDPFSGMGVLGVRQKPSPIPYSTLRRMAQVPAIAAIINTRLNQVARFARRPRFGGDVGFRIGLKDKERKMTDAEKKEAYVMEEFFLKTGAVPNRKRKDNMNQFLRKIIRDTLTLDVMIWEHVPNLGGGLAELWAIDGATIEPVINSPTGELETPPVYIPVTRRGIEDTGEIAYVQRVNGQVVAEYTEDELAFAIRNPRTDLDYTDFGMSELETLIEIVTGIMNGVKYNTSYFSSSSLPQGVLEIVGKYEDKHFEAFKRHWKTLTTGAAGKWAVPVMGLEEGQGFKFTPFKNSNRDMEFNEFLEFLFNIACAVYQIDPNEVGFKSWTSSGGSNGGNGTTQSDNTQAKMDSSQDKGFVPLMNFVSDTFNSEVIDRINPDFVFEWIGVDEEDEDKRLNREKMELESGVKTVAMIWKEKDVDIEEMKDEDGNLPEWANAPANPQLIQVYMAEKQMQQQNAQQEGAMQQQQVQQQGAMQQQQQAHQQALEMADKTHGQNMEAKKADQEHATNLEKFKAGKSSEAQKADHGHDKEMANVTGQQAEKQQQMEHGHQRDMAEHQADVTSEAQKADHGHDKEMADVNAKHAEKQQQQEHGHQRDMAEHQADTASESQDKEHKHQSGMEDKKQSFAGKQQQADHKHQSGMEDKKQEFAGKQQKEDHKHQQGMEAKKQEHDTSKQKADHKHQAGLESKKQEHDTNKQKADHKQQQGMTDRQAKYASEGKKADHKHQTSLAKLAAESKGKTKLKKSLTESDDSLEIEISWDDYK